MFAILPVLVHVFPGVSGHSLTNIPLVFCFHQVPDNHRNSKIVMSIKSDVLESYNFDDYATHSDISQKGPSIKYVTLFWTNFDSPPSVTLCHTSRDLRCHLTSLSHITGSALCEKWVIILAA